MSSRTTLTISGIDLKYVVAQYTSQLAGNGARVREVRVRALGERLRFGLPKVPTAGGQMSVRPPLQAVSGCGCEAVRRTDFARALAAPAKADATFERSQRLPPADLGRPPIREVKLVDDRAQARRRQDIVDHDHGARPQCRQLCKCCDRRHQAAKKKPSLSQHRFFHHCGDGCAFGAGSQ